MTIRKNSFLIFVFIGYSFLPCFSQNQLKKEDFEINIDLTENQKEDKKHIGIAPICRPQNRHTVYRIRDMGKYEDFYLQIGSVNPLERLKRLDNSTIGIANQNPKNAAINLGFWGVYPDPIEEFRYIKFQNFKNDNLTIPTLIISLLKHNPDIIENEDVKYLSLLVYDITSDKTIHQYIKSSFQTNLHSRFIYIVWNKRRKDNTPDTLSYCNYMEIPFNDIDNIKLVQKKEINQGGTQYNSNKEDKKESNEETKSFYVGFNQTNSRKNGVTDPEAIVILKEIKNDLVFEINSRSNLTDSNIDYNIKIDSLYLPSHYYSDSFMIDDEIHVKFKNDLRLATFEDENFTLSNMPIRFFKENVNLKLLDSDGVTIKDTENFQTTLYLGNDPDPIYIGPITELPPLYKHPKISYNLIISNPYKMEENIIKKLKEDSFGNPVILQLSPKSVTVKYKFVKSPTYRNYSNIPDTTITFRYPNIPEQARIHEPYFQEWIIIKADPDLSIQSEKSILQKRLHVRRKTIEKDCFVTVLKSIPEKLSYRLIAYNKTDDINKTITRKNRDYFRINVKGKFPEIDHALDSFHLIIEKPYGYNIVTDTTTNSYYQWEDKSFVVDLREKEIADINCLKLNPLDIFYIDLSDDESLHYFSELMNKELSDLEKTQSDLIVFISNNESPLIMDQEDGKRRIMLALEKVDPAPPRIHIDKERLLSLINSSRRKINLHLLLSNQFYRLSKKEFIYEMIIDLFELHDDWNLNQSNLDDILSRTDDKINFTIYTDSKPEDPYTGNWDNYKLKYNE